MASSLVTLARMSTCILGTKPMSDLTMPTVGCELHEPGEEKGAELLG